jgi:large subunit ribosomal protein L4
MSALSYKAKENAIVIVEDINLEVPKTKEVLGILKGLNIASKKLLFVYPEDNDNLFLSVRNIPRVNGALLADINTYDLVNADVLVLTESTAKVFAEDEAAVEA